MVLILYLSQWCFGNFQFWGASLPQLFCNSCFSRLSDLHFETFPLVARLFLFARTTKFCHIQAKSTGATFRRSTSCTFTTSFSLYSYKHFCWLCMHPLSLKYLDGRTSLLVVHASSLFGPFEIMERIEHLCRLYLKKHNLGLCTLYIPVIDSSWKTDTWSGGPSCSFTLKNVRQLYYIIHLLTCNTKISYIVFLLKFM